MDSDLGLTRHQHIGRHLGERTYTEVEVADVPLDEFPSDKEVVPAMVAHLRQRLGMVISQLSSEHRGVRVKLVRSSYPAERAGLRPGDVITHVDGVPTHTLDVFREVVYTVRVCALSFVATARTGHASSHNVSVLAMALSSLVKLSRSPSCVGPALSRSLSPSVVRSRPRRSALRAVLSPHRVGR